MRPLLLMEGRAASSLGIAAVSGLVLAIADYPVHAAPLQLVAFLPFVLAVERCERWWLAALAGAVFGVMRCAPFAPALAALPPVAWCALPIYVMLLHGAFGLSCFAARRVPAPARPLVHAFAYVALETADAHLPMWGSGLSLACAWSHYPSALRFISVTGPAGVAAIVVGAQSLLLHAPQMRRSARICSLAAVGLVIAGCAAVPSRRSDGTLRVAAIGWSSPEGPARFDTLVRDAASRGARLVVSPEAAFVALPGERDALLRRLGAIARAERVYLAAGYIDGEHHENRVAFIGPDGAVAAEYAKTHLVLMSETTRAGDGTIAIVDVDGVKVGALICQDDNFTDVAAAYARAGAQLVVTPTFEMSPHMGRLHLRNALLRPIEGGFGYLRAVANGTSAIVSNDGHIVASYDHLAGGAAALVADVPYGVR